MKWTFPWVALLGWLVPAVAAAEPAELSRPLLQAKDFEYLGAFQLPREVFGMSTAYGESGLTLRHAPGGKLHLITGGHRYTQDALYAVEYPGVSREANRWPVAKVVAEYGTRPYGQNKRIRQGKEVGWTHGITFDERTNRLYYSFGSWYNIPDLNDPSLGYAVLRDQAVARVAGPWNAPAKNSNSQRLRGGTLIIPDWFSSTYLEGRRLGWGFGGYYSGVSACSRGPYMAAVREPGPEDRGGMLQPQILINHTEEHWARRDTDYRSDVEWSPNPVNGEGFWGLYDEIFGAAIWIDLPDKHGLLMASNMGHGRVWYETSERWADRLEAWWWVYDPRDLAAVAQGRKSPWEPRPTYWKVDYQPRPSRVLTTGLAFDPESRTLFALVPNSIRAEVEHFPLVHAYRIKRD